MLDEASEFQRTDIIEAWIPRFPFLKYLSLSQVHRILRLNRIRLRFNQSQDNADSPLFDILSTGRIVAPAALTMVSLLLALFTR